MVKSDFKKSNVLEAPLNQCNKLFTSRGKKKKLARKEMWKKNHASFQSSSRAALLRSNLTVVSCLNCSLTFSRRPLSSSSPSCPPSCPLWAIWTSMFSTMAAFSGLAIRIVFTRIRKIFWIKPTKLKLNIWYTYSGLGQIDWVLVKGCCSSCQLLVASFLPL